MYTIGVIAFTEQVLKVVSELEAALNLTNHPVHIEQMIGKPQSTQLVDFYYEENAILLWLCRCYGDEERCREALECFTDARVDIIITMMPNAFEQALKLSAESNIPIIFTHLEKSRFQELTPFISHTESIITGVYDIWADMVEERLVLLTEVVPPPKTIHTFYNPDSSIANMELDILSNACITLGLELIPHTTHTPDEVKKVLTSLQTRPDHAIFRLSEPMLDSLTGLIGAIAHEQYIPYMGKSSDELERCGSLFALEPEGIGKQVCFLVDSILAENDPTTMPPMEPKSKILSINMQVAQNLGLIVSPAVLSRAQSIIPAKERRSLGSRLRNILLPATLIISIIAVAAFYLGVLPLFGLTLLSIAALAILLRVFLYRSVIRPLNSLSLAAEKIGAGELNTPILEVKVEDEVSALARALRRMKSNLSNSYTVLEELTHNLEIRVDELTEANRALRHAQHDLEIAGKRIIEAEDNSRFALTTFIHDEILGPLDELSALSLELGDARIQQLAGDLESRMRRLRFDLSVPVLQDLGVELRRLIQETLPLIYPIAHRVQMELDLTALEHIPKIEPASVFLLYRFVHGAVSNAYRHSKADKINVYADCTDDKLSLSVMDNGQGFNLDNLDSFIKNGHYFFHDIQIRARQLKGEFKMQTQPSTGTIMKVTVPIKRGAKSATREIIRYLGNKSPQLR
jgi:signal transduction histidine kinase/ABC-type uncharacterized transport system substrate-binding protein